MTYILSHGTKENKQTIMLTSDISFINAEIKAHLHDMGVKDCYEYQENGITIIDYGKPACYFIEETKLSSKKDQSNTLDYKEKIVRKQDIFKAIAKDILMIDGIDNIELSHEFIKVLLFTSEDGSGRNFPIVILEDLNGIGVSYDYLEDEVATFTLDLSTFEDIVHYMRQIQKIIDFHQHEGRKIIC